MNIWALLISTLVKIIVILGLMLGTVTYLVYFERKISAWIQNRIGPNRVGWRGVLQSFADVLKLLLKEDIVPVNANKPIHTMAPIIALFVAFTTYAIIPIGGSVKLFGYTFPLAVADVNIGILYILAITSLGVYAITFAGWSSGSKYSLLGGIRSSAQMISYEISMGFSVGGVVLLASSLRPYDIITSQGAFLWNAWIQPIGFLTFAVAAFAEANRLPFDLPEAEPELVGGYHTEYSSMKFAGFFMAEYANMIIASAFIILMYLGGYNLPFINIGSLGLSAGLVVIIQVLTFCVKLALLLFFFIWVRWTLPRFRYDQLMNLGWKVMFPLSLLNIIWVAALIMIFKI